MIGQRPVSVLLKRSGPHVLEFLTPKRDVVEAFLGVGDRRRKLNLPVQERVVDVQLLTDGQAVEAPP